MLSTPPTKGYAKFWNIVHHTYSLMFNIRSCSDGHVALSSIVANTRIATTEIVIGSHSNTRTVIRDGSIHIHAYINIFNCRFDMKIHLNYSCGWNSCCQQRHRKHLELW